MTATDTRTNGTAVGRTTTARLVEGDRILVEGIPAGQTGNWADLKYVSTTKKLTGRNGVKVATVEAVEVVPQYNGARRSTTYRTIHTDLGPILLCAPSQTFALAPELEVPCCTVTTPCDDHSAPLALPVIEHDADALNDPCDACNAERDEECFPGCIGRGAYLDAQQEATQDSAVATLRALLAKGGPDWHPTLTVDEVGALETVLAAVQA